MAVNSFLLESMPLGKPPSDWKVVYLKDVTSKIGSGATPRGGAKVYQSHGISLIRSQNVHDHKFSKEGLAFIDKEAANKLNNVVVELNDVLLNITGDSIARCCLVPNVAILRPTKKLDSTYLQKYLSLLSVKNYMLGHDAGGTRKALTKGNIERFLIPLPPLPEQKAIARILGTLDDKIELNQQMNRTLEATARAIFKSWFVDFDPVRALIDGRQPEGMDAQTAALFPDGFEDSELGMIPKGWRVAPLPEVIEVNPKRSLSKGQLAPYLDMKNMPTRGHCPDNWFDRPFKSGTKFINGDTLLARIAPCLENGKTAFVDFLEDEVVGWGSTEYIIFRPKPPLPLELGYYLARSEELRMHAIQNMTGTSGRQRTPADCFGQYLMAVPTEEIATKFGEIIKPLTIKIRANSEQSRSLSTLRDTLLPKLMSGEMRVVEAEKMVEDVT